MLDFLIALSAAGQDLQAAAAAEDTPAQVAIVQGLTVEERHIAEARRLATGDVLDLWRRLQDEKVVMADLARAFAAIMALAPESQALQAAALYTAVLKTPGCPVLSLFDRVICGNLLKLLRDVASKRPPKAKKGAPAAPTAADPMEVDSSDDDAAETIDVDPMSLVTACTEAFGAVLRVLALKDAPETARSVAEAFSEVAALPWLPAAARDAAFGVLDVLICPRHGGVRELSAMVFKLLTPATLGTLPGGKAGAKEVGIVRSATLNFVVSVIEREPGAREAAAALMRAAALRAPERADGRASAGETAAALCEALGPAYLHSFLGFLVRLSRAPKPHQRLVAVDIAATLLGSLEAPFDPETAGAPAFAPFNMSPLVSPAVAALHGGAVTPGSALRADGPEMAAAPWGAVCLAILLGRTADKGPAVRSRALHHLGTVITRADTGPAFLAALAAAEAVDLRAASAGTGALPTATAIKRRGGKGAPTATGTYTPSAAGTTPGSMLPGGVENTPGNGMATAGRPTTAGRTAVGATPGSPAPPPAPVFLVPAALLTPGNVNHDVQGLLRRARQRCRDDRAQVRKSAVQLLSAALLAGPAPASGATLSPEDLAALETATGDPLVTVRRAAAAAVAALAQAFRDCPAAVGLWVSAGLPLVRDPEATVQDAALDQVESILLNTAAAAGRVTGAAAAAAGRALRPVLAALSRAGAAGKACLARALAQLRAKGRLQGAAAATGLERLLAGDALSRDEAAGAWVLYAEIAAQAPSAPSWKFLQEQWGALGDVAAAADAEGSQHAVELLRVVATAAERFPAEQAADLCAQLRERLEPLTLPPGAAAGYVAALAQLTRAHGGEHAMKGWTTAMLIACEAALAAALESVRHADAGPTPAPAALFVAGEVALLRSAAPSSRLITLIQALTSPTLAGEAPADGADAPPSAPVPPAIQALAWASLGKLCLVSEQLAKRCVPLFAHELSRASAAAVRNNIVIALADLAARYTALVDPHVPRLAACLRDSCELVRLQALALLANLLQKDFLKWRGPLFLRFILALVDPSPRVAALAEYLLSDALESKLPNLAYNHFVEAVFALNDCRVGAGAGAGDLAGAAAAEREGFALKGAHHEARAKRDAVYQALLRRMAPEHKFATAARLCQEVLGGAADGALPLSECGEVVGDALRVLSCKAIKVSGGGRGAAAVDDADAGELAGAAKGRLVSQMIKKHLVEAVVPVVIELKRSMEAARHPLLADLMAAAAAMLKDHKSEIEDILAADRQLAKEILYDIRQAEAAEAARGAEEWGSGGAAAVAATAAKTPRTAGGAGARPPGTSGQTPIATEVLRKAGRTGGGGGGAAATPASGALPRSATAAARTGNGTRPRSLSRLARTSLAPLSTGAAAEHAEPSPTPPRLHPGRSPRPSATDFMGVGAEEGPEDHVELRFVVPGIADVGGETPSPKLWNVPAAVVAATEEDGIGSGDEMVEDGEEEGEPAGADEEGKRRGRSVAVKAAPAAEEEPAGARTRRKRRA